ncbi:MAG: glycosyltransferase family 39 protein [Anaerolineae bacterium]|nr:glycosyltransferase family 39 protein [Anaerolineae bacterium]
MTAHLSNSQNPPAPNRNPFPVSFLDHPRLVAFLLFLLALFPRLPGLKRFLTSDENTNIFFAGSDVIAAFLRGDWRGTYWHFYPGVTMSWLDALGIAGQYLVDLFTGQPVPPFTEYIYGDILTLLVANRLPYALLTAAAVPAVYLLACQLLPKRLALLGALFLAVDPFYLAHSRMAHGDAPVAVFMSLSALAFFVYLEKLAKNKLGNEKTGNNFYFLISNFFPRSAFIYLVLSAVFGGLAALTKAPGQFMALFVIGMSGGCAGLKLWQDKKQLSRWPQSVIRLVLPWLAVVVVWGGVALFVFVLLWPSMWVDPLGTFNQMWAETFGKVEEGHLVYFLGRATLDPGPWFYFYVIPFRLTPVVLLGSVLSLFVFIPNLHPHRTGSTRRASFYFWLFVIALLFFGNLSPKKQDRYLLPLFPFLDLLAAIGWMGLLNWVFGSFFKSQISNLKSLSPAFLISNFLLFILLVFHFLPVLTYYPYYLTYFNPLLGGPTRAAKTTLMGWGEGMEQVAAYLNTKPNAEQLYVASTPSQTLLPYFAGTGENFYTNDIAFRADYVVLYLAQMQRLAPSPEIVRYFEAQPPEKIITIQDVVYAKVYPGPKLILTDLPPTAIPLNIGLADTLRLAGYERQNSRLTLYWHALTPLSVDYTISVRARAAEGQLLAQQDSWPVNGLLPTSQWRQGDYVTDTHLLELPETEVEQIESFEIVVYHLATGETLGPPIVIPMNHEQ